MEKIKRKPIETVKTVIIVIMTVSMLVLAGIYIGGSQFLSNTAAIDAQNMPDGAVPVGNDSPIDISLYEKDLLAISFAGIRYGENGGGAYGNEPAARDLFEFVAEPIHTCLSSSAVLTETSKTHFQSILSGNRYIYISLVSKLPYQVIYALTGEYNAAAGSQSAINPEALLLSVANDGKASLCMKDGEKYYLAESSFLFNLPELSAKAADSRLFGFIVTDSGIALSNASPHTQTISVSGCEVPEGKVYTDILTLLDYDAEGAAKSSIVAPHGTLLLSGERLLYNASSDSGISLSGFLNDAKSTLDIDIYDILLASVSMVEQLREITPDTTGGTLSITLNGFYREDETYTIIFGLAESHIPISGDAFPYIAKLTVSSGRFKSIDMRFISAERSGYTASLFPSEWEYIYASKTNSIARLSLMYRVDSLPGAELDARWHFVRAKEEAAR